MSVALIACIVAFRFGLQNPVELEALTRGDAQRAVAVLAGDVVHREVLVRRQFPARHLEADHEHVRLADAGLAAALAGVAVFLLIAAVEFDEALVHVVELLNGGIGHLLRQRTAKVPPLFLVAFNRGQLRRALV